MFKEFLDIKHYKLPLIRTRNTAENSFILVKCILSSFSKIVSRVGPDSDFLAIRPDSWYFENRISGRIVLIYQ